MKDITYIFQKRDSFLTAYIMRNPQTGEDKARLGEYRGWLDLEDLISLLGRNGYKIVS